MSRLQVTVLMLGVTLAACYTSNRIALMGEHDAAPQKMRLRLIQPKGTLIVYNARIVRDTVFGHNIDRDSVAIPTTLIASAEVLRFDGAKTVGLMFLTILSLLVLGYLLLFVVFGPYT